MAVKETKRKAFNFLRSYFDVLNEIPDDNDKLKFLMSIINKQFLDEDPKDLNFIVNLCYESQRHSVEKSVKGWMTASGTDLLGVVLPSDTPPSTPPKGSPSTPPKEEEQEQEQEEEQAQEEEQEQVVIDNLKFVKDAIQSEQWIEAIAMNTKTSVDVVKLYLKHFESHLIAMEEQKKNSKEFKAHFVNWLNKQDLSQHRTKKIGRSNQINYGN